MDTLTTMIAVCFVIVLSVIALQSAFAVFYRPYILIRLEIITRRFASFLWHNAYTMENQDEREALFNVSEIIDSYAVVIRENRVVLSDIELCREKIVAAQQQAKRPDIYFFAANIFSVYMLMFALASRYPLIAGFFLLCARLTVFFGGIRWKTAKNLFVSPKMDDLITLRHAAT